MRLLLSDSGLRAEMGSHARDYYEEHFGLERSVGKIAAAVIGPQAT